MYLIKEYQGITGKETALPVVYKQILTNIKEKPIPNALNLWNRRFGGPRVSKFQSNYSEA